MKNEIHEKGFCWMKEPHNNMPTHIQFQSVHLCMSLHSYWMCNGVGAGGCTSVMVARLNGTNFE